MGWIYSRVKELSSWHGGALIAMGVLVLLGGPIVSMAAYAAIVWGLIAILKAD